MKPKAHYPIKAISMASGLSQHVIRIWEKRYKAVMPTRTSGNRRVYSEDDLQKLMLLKKVTEQGHSIGQIARFSVEELKKLTSESSRFLKTSGDLFMATQQELIHHYIALLLEAVEEIDANKLETILKQASMNISRSTLMEEVIVPFLVRIGEMWRRGKFKILHERLASAVVVNFLGNFRGLLTEGDNAKDIVVATPLKHHHEIGALIVAVTAASEGWHVTYLGTNVPADDLAEVVFHNHSKAIALSLVWPKDDPQVHQELRKLKKKIPPTTALFVGGSGAESYVETLDVIDAVYLNNMVNFRHYLQTFKRHLFL